MIGSFPTVFFMKHQPVKHSCLELRVKSVSHATDDDWRINFQFIIHSTVFVSKEVEDNLTDSCGAGGRSSAGESSSAGVKS